MNRVSLVAFLVSWTSLVAAESPIDAGISLPGIELDLVPLIAAISRLDAISCQSLLLFAPQSWIAPFGRLRLEGVIAPRLQVYRLPNSTHIELRLHGVDTPTHHCRVAELEWSSRDVDWLKTSFVHTVDSRYLPPGKHVQVGPGTPDFVPLSELPPYVGAAMVYSEEHGFYEHQGISADLIARAMARNHNEGRVVTGGSTITQQLVKNLFLSREKTLERKFQEAILATRVWQKVPKERVLELYLNCIEFGPGVWGIGPAAKHYFGKDARQLTIAESAFLAAIKPQPMEGEWVRRKKLNMEESGLASTMRIILRTMNRQGVIDQDALEAALAGPTFER